MDNSFIDDIIDQSNIGGPPIPLYQECHEQSTNLMTTQLTTNSMSRQLKKLAFEQAVKTTGYTLFDQTNLTETTFNNTRQIVINTSFYVFFSLFLILTILLLVLMYYQQLDLVIGLHLIILFALILYTSSVLYRYETISHLTSSTNVLDQTIEQNKMAYENSIAMQPQMMLDVIDVIS